MESSLFLYNTLSRRKEKFEPLNPPFVGMYVCGPTVYGDPHLGHARPAVTFDLIFRYLQHLGYKVRYVRNITDVGHLEHDLDIGEDKIAKKARVEQLEPMEVAQYYADRYFVFMDALNVKRPGIEPRASGHIIEQIEFIKMILDAGFAYQVNGSVYFDIEKYSKKYDYGKLSGRVLDDLLSNTRELEGQDEKHNPADFAIWKKAQPEHIMRWPSPWSDGFPGWHIECSAMGTRYLGEYFDIHGGGMDLMFPHHESEIAQNQAALGHESVKYWMHNNMVTINGQKMGKSLGNFITLDEFFTGSHPSLTQAYSPMTIRFFILQAHYRSTLDFSNEALQAAERGMKRLFSAMELLRGLQPSESGENDQKKSEIWKLEKACYEALDEDFNSPIVIANLFEGVRIINSVNDKKENISAEGLELLKKMFSTFVFDILGLKDESPADHSEYLKGLMELILQIRQRSRETKDWGTSDQIRDALQKLNIKVKDGQEGSSWELGN
ncbi:MAG: cysteine--tRNA ligase [Bacteroidetes bacterium]|nr:cysteine--tRNA ligase [Bacteroidota bacterium]